MESARGKFFAELAGIDALDPQPLDQCGHFHAQFTAAQVPELDRQLTAPAPQQLDADPRADKILQATAADDNAAAFENARVVWDPPNESVASQPGAVKI